MPAPQGFKSTLNENERDAARAALLMLKPFRDLSPTMPLSYAVAFLAVAAEEGQGVAEYAGQLEISPAVMTRNLLDIGDRNRNKEPGLGLITQERDFEDLRRHNARVTPAGRSLIHTIMTTLKIYCRSL
jgi:DNA-binding MarR family transcriptional regulator